MLFPKGTMKVASVNVKNWCLWSFRARRTQRSDEFRIVRRTSSKSTQVFQFLKLLTKKSGKNLSTLSYAKYNDVNSYVRHFF